MLTIVIPSMEYIDDKTNSFCSTKETKLQLEHSLMSISKWEAKWCKSFFRKDVKSVEETIDYIVCMTITQNVDPQIYKTIPKYIMDQVAAYIASPMTATSVPKRTSKNAKEVLTSELIYYYMVAYNIPFECQRWHLNRLITLIEVCDFKMNPPKKGKLSVDEIKSRAQENEKRKAALNTRG